MRLHLKQMLPREAYAVETGNMENIGAILIVDDDPVSRTLLADELAEAGYETVLAASGQEALEQVLRRIPELVLLDVMMPEMDGFEVCQRLKQKDATRDVPIIFLTGLSDKRDVVRGIQLGAVDYVSKPFNSAELLARVRTHIELKRSRDLILAINTQLKAEVAERERIQKRQEVSIDLAKRVLHLVNGATPRYIELDSKSALFLEALSMPCYAEGGDHFFARTIREPGTGHKRTIMALKDQSGHEVSCILRSIITDLFHNALLRDAHRGIEQALGALNHAIYASDAFLEEDFFTAIVLDIDHETREMRYASAGHPPCILIRGGSAIALPGTPEGGRNLPLGALPEVNYTARSIVLEPGDQVLLYTDGLVEMPIASGHPAITTNDLKKQIERLAGDHQIPICVIMRIVLAEIARNCGLEVAPGGANTSPDDVTIAGFEFEQPMDQQECIWHPADECHFGSLLQETVERMLQDAARWGMAIDSSRLRMALDEAALNAWRHGNESNPERAIALRWWCGNDFRFEIVDEGSGFQFEQAPDPTLPENVVKESGRGIFMMRLFADDVSWYGRGNHMVASFGRYSASASGRRLKRPLNLWE